MGRDACRAVAESSPVTGARRYQLRCSSAWHHRSLVLFAFVLIFLRTA